MSYALYEQCLRNILTVMKTLLLFCVVGSKKLMAQHSVYQKDFVDIRFSKVFVDKTLLLKEIFDHDITVITTPRQFGKSINFEMINIFLRNDQNITEVRDLFQDTKIWKDDEFVSAHMNNHPVLFCSFDSGLDVTDEDTLLSYYRQILYGIFIEHDYLKDSPVLDDNQRKEFMTYIEQNDDLEKWKIQNGLKFLTRLLRLHHAKHVIVMIDDYDSIIMNDIFTDRNSTNDYDYFNITREIFSFQNNFLQKTLENNKDIGLALITGTLPLSFQKTVCKGSKVKYVGFTQEKEYAKFYGFTEKELKSLMRKYKIPIDLQADLNKWYNGYAKPKGKVRVLNPLSVSKCLENKITLNYWIQSFPIRHILLPLMDNPRIKETIIKLVNTTEDVGSLIKKAFTLTDVERLKKIINKRLSNETDVEVFYQFLLHVGYLTFDRPRKRLEKFVSLLKIPNKEVHDEFSSIVSECVSRTK